MTSHAEPSEEIADAEMVPEPTHEVMVRPPTLAVTPQVQATELVERLAVIRQAMDNAMQDGVDYGRIPGVDKPTLLKPGSEKLGVLFQLDIQLVNEKTWGPEEHLTVISHATVFHAPTGSRLGYGEGLCSTREKKYAKRKAQRVCPNCQQAAIIKGKAEYGGGWVCWKKRDGCDSKFPDGDKAIEDQEVGEVDNPDLPDLWNTVIKMAEKRARVDAVLAVTGASALFTQDVEDEPAPADPAPAETPAPAEPDEASPKLKQSTRNALHYLLDGEPRATGNALTALETFFNEHLPVAAGQAVVIVAKAVEAQRAAANADLPFNPDIPVDDPGAPTDLPETGS